MSHLVTVRIPKVFEGPRHDRLYNIWETISEWAQPTMRLRWFSHDGRFSHAQSFARMWEEELEFDNKRVVFTEADWLPDLTHPDWLMQRVFQVCPDVALAGCCYARRQRGSRQLKQFRGQLGGWFLSMAKERLPARMEFEGAADPCTDLADYIRAHNYEVALCKGHDPYPLHCGVEYTHGTHLFWSRHLNDPRGTRVSGFSVSEIQSKHDEAVSQWIRHQPTGFLDLLEHRFGLGILGFCSGSTGARSIFGGSLDRSTACPSKVAPRSPS